MWHIHAGIHQNFENLKQGILKEMSEGAILFRRNFERLTVNTEMCVSAQTTFPSLHSQILSGAKAQPTSLKLRKGPCPLQTFCGSSFFVKLNFVAYFCSFLHTSIKNEESSWQAQFCLFCLQTFLRLRYLKHLWSFSPHRGKHHRLYIVPSS